VLGLAHSRARRLSRALLSGLLFSALLSGCRHKPAPRAKVVATIFPIYDLTRRVAGGDADVVVLVPSDVNQHQYAPSPHDLELATGAQLAVTVGLDLDAWALPMMARVAPNARMLKLGDRVPTLPRQVNPASARAASAGGAPDDDPRMPNAVDPHVWLDPQRAMLMAGAIGDELARLDPAHAMGYRARAADVNQSLDALDHEIEERSKKWKQRSIVTLHDAFQYYATRYGLEVAAVIEPTPGMRPTLRYDQVVLKRLRERHAAAIFGEPQLDSQPARTLAQAAQLPYGVLDPVGGNPGALSYEALIRADTNALEGALSDAPPPPASPPVP
jgi:zinc transport system substrate-binding protein